MCWSICTIIKAYKVKQKQTGKYITFLDRNEFEMVPLAKREFQQNNYKNLNICSKINNVHA